MKILLFFGLIAGAIIFVAILNWLDDKIFGRTDIDPDHFQEMLDKENTQKRNEENT